MSIKKHIVALLASAFITVPAHSGELAYYNAMSNSASAAQPDLSALRYFAKNNELDRYKAEMQRLVGAYPGFVPPKQIFDKSTKNDDEIWALFSQGKFKAVEAKIAAKKKADPYWQPDKKLLDHVATAKTLNRLTASFERDDFEGVIKGALQHKPLMEKATPEAVWLVGEALSKLNKTAAAVEVFDHGFQKNSDSSLIPILIQKAAMNLPAADSQYLYEEALDLSPSNGDAYRVNFLRGLVLRTKERGIAFPTQTLSMLDTYGNDAVSTDNYQDLQNLAWAFYASANYERSQHWFAQLPKNKDHMKSVEGQILSLKYLEEYTKAFAIADEWSHLGDPIAALYVNLAAPRLLTNKVKKLDVAFLTKFAELTNQIKSGEGAEALGWYAYNVKQLKAADAWFSSAINWNLTETAAFGKTLTAARRKDRAEFDRLKSEYSQFAEVEKLKYSVRHRRVKKPVRYVASASDRMSKAYRAGQYSKCLNIFDKYQRLNKTIAHDHQMHGWCLMKLDRPEEAQRAFSLARQNTRKTSSKQKRVALYGGALSALKAGQTAEADRISKSGRLSQSEYRTIRIGVLAQQALEAFRHGAYRSTLSLLNERSRMTKEPANLTELRGWSLYKTGAHHQALQVFEQLNHRLSTNKTRKAISIVRNKLHKTRELH